MSKSLAANRFFTPRPGRVQLLVAAALLAAGLAGFAQPGTKVWDYATEGQVYSSPAVGADGTLYFGSLDGSLYALFPNGTNRWRYATGGGVAASPALGSDETVYVGSLDGKLYALSPAGVKKAEFATGDAIYSSPAVGLDGTIYVGSKDQKVYALSGDLSQKRWEFVTQGEIRASPILGDDGTIYVGSRDKRFYAIRADGSVKWQFQATNWVDGSAVLGVGGMICFGSVDGRVYALNSAGVQLWDFATLGGVYSTPAVGLDGTIFVASYGGRLYALNPDGTVRWTSVLDGAVVNSGIALAADGTVYVGAGDGKLYALRNDGSRRWVFPTGAAISYAAPILGADGTVYIGSDDKRLYAVRGSSGSAGAAWPMFRRDARHTAGGFVSRALPGGYSPGAQMVVTLVATNTSGLGAYLVEDTPPANWLVGDISDNGYFDAGSRRIRFGPFLDGQSRVLTYEITPPAGESGGKFFAGLSTADGVDRLLGGDHMVNLRPLHPADLRPSDQWLTIGELTAYGAAWKRTAGWPAGPSPIPNSYLARALALWGGGEFYGFDTNAVAAPQWWANPTGAATPPPPPLPPVGATATNGWASATLPLSYRLGTNLTVTIAVTPAPNVAVVAVEDQPPAGWVVVEGSVSAGGFYDPVLRKVKWGPFFDSLPRTLAYAVSPSTHQAAFYGLASFDGSTGEIGGQRGSLLVDGNTVGSAVDRELPPGYSPGAKLLVTLRARPQPNATSYLVEDIPPAGWRVGVVSDNGFFDPVSRKVRFGPFFDALERALTYEVTSPANESGLRFFTGAFNVDGAQDAIDGDFGLDLIPLHPADTASIDQWLTIAELTAYGLAWKRGANWPAGPTPIPADYLAQAIMLWQRGEYYHLDPNITNAPLWWVNTVTNAAASVPGPLPPGLTATNGTALADLPAVGEAGRLATVTVTVGPATNVTVYAVEDQPPAGWAVSGISAGGAFDAARGKVKWGPFFDSTPRTLTYQVTLGGVGAAATFHGATAFDGVLGAITGGRQVTVVGPGLAPGTVTRALPAGSSPGARLIVTLHAAPRTSARSYAVEDTPPAGWQVGVVSDNGFFDPAQRQVRFGPFFDGLPRTFEYEVTPPLSGEGAGSFSGSFTVDGVQDVIGGDEELEMIPLHPADAQAIDSWLTIGEVTSYAAAWRRGTTWPFAPSPIPTDYLTQAILLWQDGEYYHLDPNITNAPLWWVNTVTNAAANLPGPWPPGTTATNGTAIADLPAVAEAGGVATVAIAVSPATNVTVYAVEDQPPAGWAVSGISAGGAFDAARGKVKWGPFFDHTPRTLTYQVMLPGAGGAALFQGAAAFDGVSGAIGGERETLVLAGATLSGFAQRHLPRGYSPGEKIVVVLTTAAFTNLVYYVVEDTPPATWQVGAISHDGFFDAANRKVKFGPFFDSQPRTLTYEVTPPLGEPGPKQFHGASLVDGVPGLVTGDDTMALEPPHPADVRPIDHWMTMGEVTAYGAAWKRGATWPFPPDPIPTAYLTRAVALWMGGEQYAIDAQATNAPDWWVSRGSTAPADLPPSAIQSGFGATNGLAGVDLPKFFQAGAPFLVVISLSPGSNVLVQAAEDRPPARWQVSQISGGGFYDPVRGKVKWGPFFDAAQRTLSYQVIPPSDAAELARFSGGAAFDGITEEFLGRRQTFLSGAPLSPSLGAPQLISGAGASLTLTGIPGEVYLIQASTNLVRWTPLATLTNFTGAIGFLDPAATNLVQRFYRAVWP